MSTENKNTTSILDRKWVVRSIVTILVITALYLLIRRLSGVLLPFIISFVIAYMLAPIVNFFQHKCRFKNRLLSILVTLIVITGLITGIVAAIVPAISKQATALSSSIKNYINKGDTIQFFSPEFNAEIKELVLIQQILQPIFQWRGTREGSRRKIIYTNRRSSRIF